MEDSSTVLDISLITEYRHSKDSPTYNALFKQFNTFTQFRIYNGDVKKPKQLDSHKSKLPKIPTVHKTLKRDTDEYRTIPKKCLNRTVSDVFGYALNYTGWTSFITLTQAENETDIDTSNKHFHNWICNINKLMKANGYELHYLCVPEFQKRGAIHYHLLSNIPCSEIFMDKTDLVTYSKKTHSLVNHSWINIKYWNKGYSDILNIGTDTDEHFNPGLYMIKYMLKDVDNRLFGRKRILKSNNLPNPKKTRLVMNYDKLYDAIVYIKEKYPNAIKCDYTPGNNTPTQYATSYSQYSCTNEIAIEILNTYTKLLEVKTDVQSK